MRGRLIVSTILLLALLSLGVPPAQAQTPTITPVAKAGYYWSGEQKVSTTYYTSGSPTSTYSCTSGYVVAAITTVHILAGSARIMHYYRNSSDTTRLTLYRYSVISPGTMVYVSWNEYFPVPPELLNQTVLIQSNIDQTAEVYIDSGLATAPDTTKIALMVEPQGGVSNVGILSQNVLCYVPPSPSATPPDVLRATTTSGAQYNLERTVTYGDVAVSVALLGLFTLLLFAVFLWSPRLRL